jgi:regulator of sigma E protease
MHLLVIVVEFAIVLGIMVLVHELGHFIVAKLCGVRVETFSIGFGTRLFGFRHGDTDYRISLLPLGGYVKMAGEYGSDPVTNEPGQRPLDNFGVASVGDLTSKPRWQRVLIAVAGPFANFLLAFFLLFLVAHYHHEVDQYLTGPAIVDYVPVNSSAGHDGLTAGDTITRFNKAINPTWEQLIDEAALNLNRPLPITYTHNGQAHDSTLTIAADVESEFSEDNLMTAGLIPRMDNGPVGVLSVTAGSPADHAGLKAGDQLVRINTLYPHSVYALLAFLKDDNGATSTLGVLRNGQPLTLIATPEKMASAGAETQYRLGFTYRPPPADIQHLPVGAALAQSYQQNRNNSKLVLRIIHGLFTRHVSIKQMSGPVGIAQQIDIATQMGIWPLVDLMAVISLQLGIFNLFPVPPLDGGMIFFLLVESIMRRDVNQKFKELVYQVAFVCVILFAFFILFNDITKLHIGH